MSNIELPKIKLSKSGRILTYLGSTQGHDLKTGEPRGSLSFWQMPSNQLMFFSEDNLDETMHMVRDMSPDGSDGHAVRILTCAHQALKIGEMFKFVQCDSVDGKVLMNSFHHLDWEDAPKHRVQVAKMAQEGGFDFLDAVMNYVKGL